MTEEATPEQIVLFLRGPKGPEELMSHEELLAEIVRLRAENKQFREQVCALLEGAQDDTAEIERLRGGRQGVVDLLEAKNALIERLRAEIELVSK
jgi:hypothetical protein